MPSFSAMKSTIYDIIKAVSSLESMYAWQDSPIINKPFFSLDIRSFGKVGRDCFTAPNASGLATMIGNREFTLMIQGKGVNTFEKTTQLQTAFEKPDIHDLFRAGGIFPFNIDEPVLNISGLDQSQPEERSSWDIFMRTDSVITDVPIGLILKINAEATFSQPGKADIERTLNIDTTT